MHDGKSFGSRRAAAPIKAERKAIDREVKQLRKDFPLKVEVAPRSGDVAPSGSYERSGWGVDPGSSPDRREHVVDRGESVVAVPTVNGPVCEVRDTARQRRVEPALGQSITDEVRTVSPGRQ